MSLLGFYHRFYLVRFEQHNELSFLDAKDHIQFERIFGKLEFLEYAYLCSSSIFSTHEKQVSVEEAKCHDLLDWIGAYTILKQWRTNLENSYYHIEAWLKLFLRRISLHVPSKGWEEG